MKNIKDENGHNQIFAETNSTIVRFERRAKWMINEVDTTKNADVLEIGCGIGKLSNYFAQHISLNVIGTDISLPFIEQSMAKYQKPNLNYMYLDFNNPEILEGKKFDYIIGNGILHHLYYDIDSALVNIRKLLKKDGKMIFMEPNIYNPYCALIFKNNYFRKKASLEPDEMAFSDSYIIEKLLNSGYSNVKVEFKDFLLPGIPDIFITPSIVIGDVLESIPIINKIAQSLFIVGKN